LSELAAHALPVVLAAAGCAGAADDVSQTDSEPSSTGEVVTDAPSEPGAGLIDVVVPSGVVPIVEIPNGDLPALPDAAIERRLAAPPPDRAVTRERSST
jgi:hypothetical protein